MRIRVGYEITYDCPQPTPMVLMLNIHHTRAGDIVVPDRMMAEPFVPVAGYRDGFGNWCSRIVAPAGRLRLSADSTLNDTGLPDPIARSEQQHAVEDLPEDSLVFLLGSRYCETDRLTGIAWDLFGRSPTGAGRVQAICDYVHRHITFNYQDARSTRTALQAFEEGKGVCRDYAHLAIAFCRCMNIPARYCTGYLGDIGIPPPYGPDGFCRLVRGLHRRPLAYVRRPEQRPADRPRAHRPWARCDRCGDQQYVRPQHARRFQGLGRRGRRHSETAGSPSRRTTWAS